MAFSQLKEVRASKDTVSVFGGYNHNIQSSEGEFYDMVNMSSTNYPTLSPREKRGQYKAVSATGIIAKDELCYTAGTDLYIGDTKVPGVVLTDTPKQIVSMGAYIIIMPDKVYVNTKDVTDYGTLDNTVSTVARVTYSMCNLDGEDYRITYIQDDPPENPQNMELWIDTSKKPNALMQYSELTYMWVSVAASYVKIASQNIAKGFAPMDAVKISGIDSSLTQLASLNDVTSIMWDVHRDTEGNGSGDYVIVPGIIDTVSYQDTPITLTRSIPTMDFVIESGNRLWGCRYGEDEKGNMVNELYASKQGDFKNFNFFAGTAADSYVASCGTDGEWTGAISYLGYPMFFKEDNVNKVYGNYPANFQIKTTALKGVQKGASGSLVVANDYLIYKSRDGICAYDGSLPSEISSALGNVRYRGENEAHSGIVAGFCRNKYYISMLSDEDNAWHLLVYDIQKRMWHKEDSLRVDAFCAYKDELYYIDHDTKNIRTIYGSGDKYEDDVAWMVETNVLGLTAKESRYTVASPGKKYIGQILVRMSMEIGTRVSFKIQYDSVGDWNTIAYIEGTSLRSFFVPIRPRRCDHFKIRISGIGKANIYSYTKIIEQGSDY